MIWNLKTKQQERLCNHLKINELASTPRKIPRDHQDMLIPCPPSNDRGFRGMQGADTDEEGEADNRSAQVLHNGICA